MALLDDAGGGGYAPSAPADTSSPPLPAPPFDVGGFLSNLSKTAFNTTPQQVGQGFSNFGSGALSNLSSFGSQVNQRGLLGTDLGEALFPGANEGLHTIVSPLEPGGALGGTPDFPSIGRWLNQNLQDVANATDTTTNPTAKTISGYGVGLPQALSVIHGSATTGQGLGNFLQQSPQFENQLQDAFRQGLKSSSELQSGQTALSDQDFDSATQKLLQTGSDMSNTLYDQTLMHSALENGFKSWGADDTLAKNGADALASPINYLAQFTGGSPMAAAMLVQFVGQMATNPSSVIQPLMDTSPSYDFASEQSSINNDINRANNGELSQQELDALQKRIDVYNAKLKQPDAGQLTTGDFLRLLGDTAHYITGGPAPDPKTVSKGLTELGNLVGMGFMAMHGAKAGLRAGSVASYKLADLVDRNKSNTSALDNLTTAVKVAADESRLRNQYGATNIQQTPETGATGKASEISQAAQAGAVRASQTASRAYQGSQGPGIATAESTEGIQRQGVSAAYSKPVSTLEDAKSNLQNAGINVHRDLSNLSAGWILPDGSAADIPTTIVRDNNGIAATTHDALTDIAYGNSADRAFTYEKALADGWIRVRDEVSQPDSQGRSTPEITIESGTMKTTTANRIDSYLMSKASQYSSKGGGTIYLDVSNPDTGNTKTYAIRWPDYVGSGFDIRRAVKDSVRLGSTAQPLQWDTSGVPAARAQFAMGGDPVWQGGHVMDQEAIRFAENTLEQTGNNANGVVKKVVVRDTRQSGSRANFVSLRPNEIQVSPISSSDVLSHAYEWKQAINKFLEGAQDTASPLIERAKQVAAQNLRDLSKNIRGQHILADVVNHEAVHAQIQDIADRGPVDGSDEGNTSITLSFVKVLRDTQEGRAYLDSALTQGLRGQIHLLYSAIDRFAPHDEPGNPVLNLSIVNWMEHQLTPEQRTALNQAASDVEEHFNYQINRYQGTNTHPYIIQSGEEAYAHSFWNPDATEQNAQLAGAWWDKYGPASETPISGSRPTAARQGSSDLQLGGISKIPAAVAARASRRVRNSTDSDQTRLSIDEVRQVVDSLKLKPDVRSRIPSDPQNWNDQHRQTIADAGMKLINQMGRRVEKLDAQGNDRLALKVQLQRLFTSRVLEKVLQQGPLPRQDSGVTKTPNKPVDYEGEALRISNGLPESNLLAPLKDVAGQVTAALQNFNTAKSAGLPAQDLQQALQSLQFHMARFRSAYDLYNSREFKTNLNKQSNDWTSTRGIARKVENSTQAQTPRDKALLAVRLLSEQLKKPYTLQDAGQAIKNTSLGITKEAKNWHPDFRKLLAGEMWDTVKQVYKEDPRLPLGIGNIPVHELFLPEDYQALHDGLEAVRKQWADQNNQLQLAIKQNSILEKAGKATAGTTAAMIKSLQEQKAKFEDERAMLQAKIDNHIDNVHSRIANPQPLNPSTVNATPSMQAAQAAYGTNPHTNQSNATIAAQNNALNQRITTPIPDPFSVESFIREGATPPTTTPLPAGKPWFSDGWNAALTDLRELGGDHKLLADLTNQLVYKMGEHLDPTRTMWHPKQWFKAHWEDIAGIPQAVSEVQRVLDRISKNDSEFSKAVLSAIDDTNDTAQKVAAGTLTPEQAAVANFLNQYWKTTRELFKDPELGQNGLIPGFVDNYVPHIVLKDPQGNDIYNAKKARWGSSAPAAKKRLEDGLNNEPIYRTLQDLENKGYTVEWDLGKVFGEHANSTFKMMKVREMFNTLRGNIYHSPDGSFVGHPVIHSDDFNELRGRLLRADNLSLDDQKVLDSLQVFDDPRARVRYGPGTTMFQGFKVHPDLAREIELLANLHDMPGSGLARFLRSLGGLFKFVEFSINPRHAFNVFSNISNMHSAAGVFSPTVWRNIYGRANRAMLPEQQGAFFRNVSGRDERTRIQGLINEQAAIERQMHGTYDALKNIGPDPNDPNPRSLTPQEAALRDNLNNYAQTLIEKHQQLDQALGGRDRQMLGEFMSKGLVPDHDLINSADLAALTNYSEKIPGIAQFHRWLWRDVVWRGQVGTAMHLADQFIMKAAKNYGWDGQGGAAQAEQFITPELKDRIQREAIFSAKQATGLLNKLDMTQSWQLWGRATLLSAPWTLGQLQATRDMLGGNFNQLLRSNKYTKPLAGEDWTHVSDDMLKAGFGKEENQFLDYMHTKLARRMILSGVAKLAMTSLFLQSIGTLIYTGQPGNPITNFLRDPLHTFDIYKGKDPATGADMWADNPFYSFQREVADYALASVKAGMEGKGWWQVGVAPLTKFANKSNPLLRNLIDVGFGIETSRWLAGYEPGMDKDTDLQNLHRGLDNMGVPDFGSVEDRILYILRNLPRPSFLSTGTFPSTAIKRNADLSPVLDQNGQQIPLTDPRSLLTDFGFGGLLDPSSLLTSQTALSNLGVTQVNSSRPLYDWSPFNPTSIQQSPASEGGFFPEQAKIAQGVAKEQAYQQSQQALVLIANLSTSDDPSAYSQIAQIRDQYGLTDNQVTNAIMYGASTNINGTILKSKGLGGTGVQGGSLVNINGQNLSEAQSVQYNKMLNNNELYAIQQLKDDPEFQSADGATKAMLMREYMNVAAKFTTAQAGQQFQGMGGKTLQAADYAELVSALQETRQAVSGALSLTPEYQSATPAEKVKMYQSYMASSSTIAWDQQLGNLKGLSDAQLQMLVGNSVRTDVQTMDYLKSTPFYTNATAEDQAAMEKTYSALSKQMNLNIYNGTTRNMMPYSIPMYMQSVINTEETAKYLLHQSDFYQTADLKTQQSLDSKYETLSRSMALKDWSNGKPLINLGSVDQAFSAGSDQIIVGHLMAEQGYVDLQNQFGGPQAITAYSQQETQLRQDIRTTTVASPTVINRTVNLAVAAFERANPQYAAFKKARTNWERGSSIGRLYAALNADDQSLATVDTSAIDDPTAISSSLSQVLPGVQLTPEEQAAGLA